MISNDLNLNRLWIFASVYRNKSMTLAARELHLTQSGISQHMKSLEESLGLKLFDRVQQRLVPTSASTLLFEQCRKSLEELNIVLEQVQVGKRQISGNVALGLPIEFANNRVIPLLAEFMAEHPNVTFTLNLGYASTMNDALLKGELDFAYVDSYRMDRRIVTKGVYREVLELCAHESLVKELGPVKMHKKFLSKLEYVEYQEDSPLLKMWFRHHLKSRNMNLRIRARVMDVQGNARFIREGAVAGILPSYLVKKIQSEGQPLVTFKGSGKPLTNTISIAYLPGRTQSRAAQSVMDFLSKEIKNI